MNKFLEFYTHKELKIQDFLLKKLFVYGLLHSKAHKDTLKALRSSFQKDNNIKYMSDEELAELSTEELFAVSPRLEIMGYAEATIMTISEYYGAAKRNSDKDLRTILKECDDQRSANILDLLDENEINLENYIIKLIEVEDTNNVFEKLDKDVLKQQIKIAEEFQQYDLIERAKFYEIEESKSDEIEESKSDVKYKYGHEVDQFERGTIIEYYDSVSHILDKPLERTAEEIINYSNQIISFFKDYNFNDEEFLCDIDWTLIHMAKNIDRATAKFLSNKKIQDLLHVITFRQISFKICEIRNFNNQITQRRLKRMSTSRNELIEAKGLKLPKWIKQLKDIKDYFFTFTFYYHLDGMDYQQFSEQDAYRKTREIFNDWEIQCNKNHYYFLTAMENPVGQYIRSIINEKDMENKVKTMLRDNPIG